MAGPLILGGPPCTGKSAVGRIVAQGAGVAWVDLDEQLAGRNLGHGVGRAGARLPEVRKLEESLLLAHLTSGTSAVVAVSWEALLERRVRLEALERAVVVNLDASASELLRRARASGHWLAQGDAAEEAVAAMLESRRVADAEAHARVSTERLSPEETAARVVEIWKRNPVVVAAGERTYCVEVGVGRALQRSAESLEASPVAVLVTDANVARLHSAPLLARLTGSGSRPELIVLEPGEQHKTPDAVKTIWERALRGGADRSTVLMALGGGVVTDVAGFAAATYMRGIRWVALPTTLLGMVDASVGGKTAVDLGSAKNAVGAFWQPSLVLCDPEYLLTEPERGYVSGLAEVVKTALIGDPTLLDLIERRGGEVLARNLDLLSEVVRRAVSVKASVVSRDEREAGLRAVLNLGHTVGHALEAAGGYGNLSHGEAVSLGLVAALRIGRQLGRTPAELVERITALLGALGLPTALGKQQLAEATGLLMHDKKRAGEWLKFVVVEGLGRVRTTRLRVEELIGLTEALA